MLLTSTLVQARTLSWDALEVDARLDRDGRLHIVERHSMVFDGDWNGGERRFRVDGDQQFSFSALSEIDAEHGVKRSLHGGDLSKVGEYRFFDDHVLRWRARLPSDPPFHNARRIYEIEYVLSRIVVNTANGYTLSHDFAFPDRSGTIDRFTVHLAVDPSWRVESNSNMALRRDTLQPGQGAVLNVSLTHSGATLPSEIAPSGAERVQIAVASLFAPHPDPWRYIAFWTVLLLVGVRAAIWYRHDRACGKFTFVSDAIDRRWIETHLLRFAPEFVGAAWDMTTSANEVAAVIARMTQEGKLKSKIVSKKATFWSRDVLQLTLCRDRRDLQGYERALIDALFVGGGNSTDTEKVRDHYKNRGFDPAKLLKPMLDARIAKMNSNDRRAVPAGRALTAVLLLGAALCALAGMMQPDGDAKIAFAIALSLGGLLLIGSLSAHAYRIAVDRLARTVISVVVCTAVVLSMTALSLLGAALQMPPFAATAMALAALGIVNSLFNRMQYRDSLDALRVRKKFLAARRYFERELKTPAPRIDDAWYPYVLAFGLGGNADRWFKVHSTRKTTLDNDSAVDATPNSASSSGGGVNTWSGGGGAFGGGGASGSWATAIGGIAASVPAPSSSSSDGGGSSGGGGGGGW